MSVRKESYIGPRANNIRRMVAEWWSEKLRK